MEDGNYDVSSSIVAGNEPVPAPQAPQQTVPEYPQQDSSSNNNNNNNENDNGSDDSLHKTMPWNGKEIVLENVSQVAFYGGAERGLLPCVDLASTGDVLLEVDGIPVLGFTSKEIQTLLSRESEHTVKLIEGGNNFPIVMRDFLSRRFLPDSSDERLQAIVRNNVYNNTVPYTTRMPAGDEQDGLDYCFIDNERFIQMEKDELLIESGVYCGFYYATMKPQPEQTNNLNDPPTKRQRRQSFISAIDASMLPFGWERISDAQYGVYYIDHLHKKTQYERPYEVELKKSPSGFGFTLVEIDNGHLMLKSLIEGSPAHLCGVIHTGDVLISVSDRTLFGLTKEDIGIFFSQYKVGETARMTFARGFPIPNDFLAKDYQDLWIDIVKGDTGFGFLICQSPEGQTVSGVNNKERCQGLEVDDLLISVNNIDLQEYSHMEVAEILSECPVGKPTRFVIRRKRKSTYDAPLEENVASQPEQFKVEPNGDFYAAPKQNISSISNMIEKPVSCSSDMSYGPYRSEDFELNNGMDKDIPYIPGLMVDPDMMYEFLEVILSRDESGFGIRIGGGKEEATNIFVNLVIQDTPAYFDGRLKAGDEIIKLNDDFVVGWTHKDFVKRMSTIGRSIKLLLRRRHFKYAFDVVLERNNTEGFGFVIISCGNCALIGRIIEHSPAWRCDKLKIRDRIVAVNGTDVTLFSHTDIVKMIKNSGQRLCLKIVPTDLYTVELMRGPNGFGFSLRGGAEYDNSTLTVSDVQKFGPADEGGVSPGDEILAINGVATQDMARAWALNLIGQYPVVKLFMRKTIKMQAPGMQTALYANNNNAQYEQYQQPNPYQLYSMPANGQMGQFPVAAPAVAAQQQQPIYATEDDLQYFASEHHRAQL